MDTHDLLAPPEPAVVDIPAEVTAQIEALEALASLLMGYEDQIAVSAAAGDSESVHRLYRAARAFRRQVEAMFDTAEQTLARTVGKGATTTPVGFVQVMQVPDSKQADWPTILDKCESRALWTEDGEQVADVADGVHRFREIIEAVAPLTSSVMPRATLDPIVDRREVVQKRWNNRYNVTST